MIGYLRGTLLSVSDTGIVLDVGGVGYEVTIDRQTLASLTELGAPLSLTIRTVVREDAITLYGFVHPLGRTLFDLLLGVSGVGPKMAAQILGGLPLEELIAAVRERNVGQLSRIPGVGKKTAERLGMELSDKFKLLPVEAPPRATGLSRTVLDDVRSALANLGFTPRDIEAAVAELDGEGGAKDLEDLLRAALSTMKVR